MNDAQEIVEMIKPYLKADIHKRASPAEDLFHLMAETILHKIKARFPDVKLPPHMNWKSESRTFTYDGRISEASE